MMRGLRLRDGVSGRSFAEAIDSGGESERIKQFPSPVARQWRVTMQCFTECVNARCEEGIVDHGSCIF